MRVLLSIRPEHVDRILSGRKTFEFRRRLFARRDIRTVLIYCTRPVGQLVGEFDIAEILQDAPGALWRRTRDGSGITKAYFDAYFAGRSVAYALHIGAIRSFDPPIPPSEVIENFTPPQSYRYVPDRVYAPLPRSMSPAAQASAQLR
jgi:predicted transcriptional regulator